MDIVIGTHRALSKDVKFNDLGLVIVDEEQRFGVRHKERLKQLRKEVDVLTMSATPIPRTLHMSLLGLRDMSVIETPPKDRMAIQTVVAAWDEKLLRSAIEKELERGGQVYFVHNRVESIYEIADKIREMSPKARILVGHGQMPESELERIMLAFMRHEADILVATTIIENGLDIPLVQHHHHQPRRPARVVGAIPAARARRPLRSPRVCVLADSAGPRSDRPCAAPAGGSEGVQRPRRGLQDCRARSGTARRR